MVFLEIDGLALPVLQRAMRDGSAPTLARWLPRTATHRLAEWETDLSSQTGASQAGILLGSNEDIPAFRWVEKETGDADDVLGAGRLRRDRAAPRVRARAARERRREPRQPPLRRGRPRDADGRAASRPRSSANPGYRAFFANGFNVTRVARPLRLGGRARGRRRRAGEAARRAPARPPRRHLPVPARGHVRRRPRPDRLRRPHRHDEGAARDLRDVLELRRGRAPLRASSAPTRWRRCASSTSSSAGSSAPAGTRRGRTRSSSSPTTGRRRGRPSSSGTATGSRSSSGGRSTAARSRASRGGDEKQSDGRTRRRRGDGHAKRKPSEERRERPGRRRARLRATSASST